MENYQKGEENKMEEVMKTTSDGSYRTRGRGFGAQPNHARLPCPGFRPELAGTASLSQEQAHWEARGKARDILRRNLKTSTWYYFSEAGVLPTVVFTVT